MYVIGIDVGTTGAKVVLVDAAGKTIGETTRKYETVQPQSSWFEQDPEDWWIATRDGISEVVARFLDGRSEGITSIGLTGQYHGLVALTEDGSVIRPCILWNDQRTGPQYQSIIDTIGQDGMRRVVASIGGLYSTLCKLLWVRDNEPENYEKIRHVLLPKDYVRFRLTGEFATDVSDASGTAILDVRAREWSEEMCENFGIDTGILPRVYESHEITGTVRSDVAGSLGLPSDVTVVAGAGDQACAALGNGIFDEGVVGLSLGTSGVLYAATNEPRTDPNGRLDAFCHAVPGRWALLGVTNAAAASLAWLVNSFIPANSLSEEEMYRLYGAAAETVPPGSEGLLFLPYLAGERHPHRDPEARGAFFGLNARHEFKHAYRAVMEGVAFSFRDCIEVMRNLGVHDSDMRGTGGGLRSRLWSSIQANVIGRPIKTRPGSDTGAAYGAAMLALVGAGTCRDIYEAGDLTGDFRETASLVPENVNVYDALYQIYKQLYPQLREPMHALSKY